MVAWYVVPETVLKNSIESLNLLIIETFLKQNLLNDP